MRKTVNAQAPSPILDPNGVLREWRLRKTGLSQRAAAQGIPASPGALNVYEKSGGNIPAEAIRILDRLYGADGMLDQFVGAAAVPAAYDARRDWVHNFLDTTGPVWAWVRPVNPAQRFATSCHWGAFEVRISEQHVDAEPNGFIITSPIAVALPAVFIEQDPPGWVAFGSGVPPTDLGVPVLSGLPLARRFSGLDMTVGAIGRGLRKRFGRPTREELEGLARIAHSPG